MERMRKPLQGVWNIVRFNWHFYVISVAFLAFLYIFHHFIAQPYRIYVLVLGVLAAATTLVSLLVSLYVYDLSNLYSLNWIGNTEENIEIVNINAGFDETSTLLKAKFPGASLTVLDFYDPQKHTEISIKRARKAYPPFLDTKKTTTSNLPLPEKSIDKIFLTLSAHEIRDANERVVFFGQIRQALKPAGQIIVTEHLRDTANFLAYNIGFLHFLSKPDWHATFRAAQLTIEKEQKITPFITVFTLEKHGVAP